MEDRRVLSAVTVNTVADVVDAPNLTSIAALIANPGADGRFCSKHAAKWASARQFWNYDSWMVKDLRLHSSRARAKIRTCR